MEGERLFFKSQGLLLEGLICRSDGKEAVVVTHPHPLYGGDMHNNIVESLVRAYRQKGYTTLRFNFRGVGRSEGVHDNGTGEREDVKAAVGYLCEEGKSEIDLAGYSFGAWVGVQGVEELAEVKRVIMVSPPVDFIDFSHLKYSPKIRLVIAGSEDDIASPATIEKMLPEWNRDARFEVVQGADHFYWGKTDELEEILEDYLPSVTKVKPRSMTF